MDNTILEIKNLKKNYQTDYCEIEAISDFTFSLKDNEFVAIIGPSGSGKTTILSILANLLNKTSGEINLKENKKIGYMLQQDSLFEWRTILNNCLLGLEINKTLNNDTKNKVIDLLKKYGLNDFIESYPRNLSGGMRQRAALIRTLANNPDILLLDEPFSALDYQTRLMVENDVYNIIKNEKKSAIMVTHDLAEAICMADKIVVLSNRPSKIKNIYEIKLEKNKPFQEIRSTKNFFEYYDLIWKDIDKNV